MSYQGIGGSEDVTHLPLEPERAKATYDSLQGGSKYVDPTGTQRIKPFEVKDQQSYGAVPDGATYKDPTGTTRKKPEVEGVGFAAQTLFDMSTNDDERHKALARTYGDKNVKRDPGTGEFSVTADGKTLKPGHGKGVARPAAALASAALPVGGAVAGGILGAPAGGVGAIGGAAAGGAAGQGANDALLAAAGVYSKTVGQEASNLALSGASSAIGEGGGRLAGAALPFVKGAIEPYVNGDQHALSSFLGKFLGVSPEGVKTAQKLTDQGVKVRPSAYIKEAPMITKEIEQFGPAFYDDPFKSSAKDFYEQKAGDLLKQLGAPLTEKEKLTEAAAKPSSAPAGQAMIDKVKGDVARTDAKLEQEMNAAKTQAQTEFGEKEAARTAQIDQLSKAAKEAQDAANQAVDLGFKDIDKDIADFNKTAAASHTTGALWQQTSDKIVAANKAMKETAGRLYYRPAEEIGKMVQPDVAGLKATAKAVQDSFPAGFSNVYPGIFNTLKGIETGKASLAQLHELSQEIASRTNWSPITADAKDGLYKHFVAQIKDLIMKPPKDNPAWAKAADLIKGGDAFYAKNRPKFDDAVIKHIVSGTEAGLPPNPSELAQVVFKEENSARIAELKNMIGTQLWPSVEAAHVQSLFDTSKRLDGKVDAKTFVAKVLGSIQRSGLKQMGGSALPEKVITQAKRAAMLSGELSVEHMPGDTVATYLKRVADTNERLESVAKQNPLGELESSVKHLEQRFRDQRAAALKAYRADPLSLLYRASPLAEKSADAILDSPDLLKAAAAKFGPDSMEFDLLRQVGAKRILQREIGSTGGLRKELGKTLSEETQKLLFPGTAYGDVHQLAHDMEFLMGGDSGGAGWSIAAQSRVTHPWVGIIGEVGKFISEMIAGPVGRTILSTWYKLLTSAVTSPKTLNFLAKGLGSSDPAERDAARALVKKWANIGGAAGAGLGQDATQNNGPQQ